MLELLADTVGLRFYLTQINLFTEGASISSPIKRFTVTKTKKPPLKVAGKNKHKEFTLHERHITSVLSYDIVKFLGESDCSFVSAVSIKCGKLGYDFDNQSHQRLL